jgi:prophage antirepressor-like protein
MTALDVFEHGNWSVRTLLVDGVPWFVAADVCAALGFSNPRQAVSSHVADEHRDVQTVDTPGGRQQVTVIDEPGMYALAFGSRLPSAAAFRDWVFSEVLPALRHTGTYTVPAAMPTHAEALRGWADAVDQVAALEHQVAELEPVARFATTLAAAGGDWSVREAAQILDRDPAIQTGERRLFTTLKAIGWLDRTGQPYQGHVNVGRLVCRVGHYRDARTDELVAYSQVRVTPKGLRDLHQRLGGQASLVALETTGDQT